MIECLLGAVPFLVKFGSVLFVLISVSLVLLVLIQKGRGGGLGAAFGGAAGSLLGTKTGDFLTWVTIGLVGLFLLLAIALDRYRPKVTPLDSPIAPTTSQAPAVAPAQRAIPQQQQQGVVPSQPEQAIPEAGGTN